MTSAALLPCSCHGDDPEPYCPRHTPLPGEDAATTNLVVTVKCLPCDGDGYTERWIEDDEGRDFPVSIPCSRCGGTGELRADGEDDPE